MISGEAMLATVAPGTLALAILGAVLLVLVVAGAWAWGRRGPEDDLLRALLRGFLAQYLRVVHRLRFTPGRPAQPIPLEGPAIVVANHRSGVDPLAISGCTPRVIRFLMAREYYEQRGLRWLFRTAGCIPVNRDGNDLGATKAALQSLRHGEVIGIFPEGGIQMEGARDDGANGQAPDGKSGVALLALRSGAPVVPVHIAGTPNLGSVFRAVLTPSRTRVAFGEPMSFTPPEGRKPTREEMEGVTRRILERIRELGSNGERGGGGA